MLKISFYVNDWWWWVGGRHVKDNCFSDSELTKVCVWGEIGSVILVLNQSLGTVKKIEREPVYQHIDMQ